MSAIVRRRIRIAILVILPFVLLAAVWRPLAHVRLQHAHNRLLQTARAHPEVFMYEEPELNAFLEHAELNRDHSLGPLMKWPFRFRVFLYYVHEPRYGPGTHDAYATVDWDGGCFLKIHR